MNVKMIDSQSVRQTVFNHIATHKENSKIQQTNTNKQKQQKRSKPTKKHQKRM